MVDVMKMSDISEPSIEDQIEELKHSIMKAEDSREAKCIAAKSQLVENLKVTSDKFRTVNGTMSALRILKDLIRDTCSQFEISILLDEAKILSTKMAKIALDMSDKAESLDWSDMDQLCDGFYAKKFSTDNLSLIDTALECMKIDLCAQVGPNAEDIVEFLKRSDEEIKSMRDKLKELEENQENQG